MIQRIYLVAFILANSLHAFAQGGTPAPIIWEKSLGGSSSDIGRSVARTLDSGFIVLGTSSSTDGDVTGHIGSTDIWICRLTIDGTLIWEKSIGGLYSDEAGHIIPLSDRTYLIGGTTQLTADTSSSQWLLVKTNDNGDILWQKTYGGPEGDILTWIDTTADSSIYCAGHSRSSSGDFPENKGQSDIWVMKLDPQGELLWKRNIGGSSDDYAAMVQATSDGGCILAGTTASQDSDMSGSHGATDGVIAKFDSSGNISWIRFVGTAAPETLNALEAASDGTFAISGMSMAEDPNGDFYIVQLNPSGNIVWDNLYGGSARDEATLIQEVEGGGYQVIGTSRSAIDTIGGNRGEEDWLFLRINPDGSKRQSRWFGGSAGDYSDKTITRNAPGGYVSAGSTNSTDKDVTINHGGSDIWVIRYGGPPATINQQLPEQFIITPNPTEDHVAITLPGQLAGKYILTLSNISGEQLLTTTLDTDYVTLDVSGLAAGTYFLSLQDGSQVLARNKFVKK